MIEIIYKFLKCYINHYINNSFIKRCNFSLQNFLQHKILNKTALKIVSQSICQDGGKSQSVSCVWCKCAIDCSRSIFLLPRPTDNKMSHCLEAILFSSLAVGLADQFAADGWVLCGSGLRTQCIRGFRKKPGPADSSTRICTYCLCQEMFGKARDELAREEGKGKNRAECRIWLVFSKLIAIWRFNFCCGCCFENKK